MADEMVRVAVNQDPPLKPVQELIKEMSVDGGRIPESYLNRLPGEDDSGVEDGSFPVMEAPMIDLGLLFSPVLSQRDEELAKLRSALDSWSCVQLVNHGMSSDFLDQVRQASRQFFALSQEEKSKNARSLDHFDGYGKDNVYGKGSTVDWCDRLELLVNPEDKRNLRFWPDNLRGILDQFTAKSKLIVGEMLKAMALLLDLEETSFVDLYGEEPIMLARVNFYPPCPRPELVLGNRPHFDGTALTVLLPDDQVESLQVQKDDQWFKVASIPHALLIVVGDQMEMITGYSRPHFIG